MSHAFFFKDNAHEGASLCSNFPGQCYMEITECNKKDFRVQSSELPRFFILIDVYVDISMPDNIWYPFDIIAWLAKYVKGPLVFTECGETKNDDFPDFGFKMWDERLNVNFSMKWITGHFNELI